MSQATSRATLTGAYRPSATPGFDLNFGRLTVPLRWLIDRRRRAQAIRELNRLSDRHLLDIGIAARGDIEAIVEAMVRRRRR